MDDGSHHDVEVPDGVGQRDDSCNTKYSQPLLLLYLLQIKFTVRFEEKHSQHVDCPASLELGQARLVSLKDLIIISVGPDIIMAITQFIVIIIPFSML